ncbi:MAG: MATE family efflux transporter [Actinobacteria bacterium]|nr:MATE family efflux transporter [Actinomycetota bacterium]
MPSTAATSNRSRDRRIFALAIPALGALAAEPTYLLVDTAIVGHLGTTQLAALAMAATFLGSAFWLFNFLAYGTTAQVSRLHGAGDPAGAGAVSAQALWLALAIGAALVVVGELLAPQIVAMLQGDGAVGEKAETYLRISFLGAPFVMVVLAGEGYLRGVQRMSVPLKILVVSNLVNVVLELWFVFGLDWDLAGSAWGTVIAQAGAGVAFGVVLLRAAGGRLRLDRARMRSLARIGGNLVLRTAALLVVFNVTVALLAAEGEVELAAHQVILQVFLFLALTLDALAVAAQTLVGSHLGAGDAIEARALSRRITVISAVSGALVGAVLFVGSSIIPDAFTRDDAVIRTVADAWWLFALMQPFNAMVFGWDGVLMGAGDTRFLMLAMFAASAVCVPVAALTIAAGWGLLGAWTGIATLIAIRFITNVARVEGGRWIQAGPGTDRS